MTGRWQNEPDKYCRWYIELDDGERIWFRNPRCLATLQFTDEERVFQAMLDKLGPDILSDNFTLSAWKSLLQKHRNKNVTSFLMDQNILSGCGNYIKAEALYYSKISPLRKVRSLKEHEDERLYEALRIIPRKAYNDRGLSLRDYADSRGKKGYYERQLKVYGKSSATRTKTPDGRTTYWDPEVQK
jgi:formamidopyrimidine-DNA glycosylase